MKRWTLILFLVMVAVCSKAQNIVANGSFESYSNCPTTTSQLTGYCIGWSSYTNGTPDYYNTCASSSSGASVPLNINGNQSAASGNAYCGIVDYAGSSDFKEYITTTIGALQPGGTYQVSMYISLADNAGFASDGLGMFFYKDGPATVATTNKLNFSPQVSFSSFGPVSNKSGWTKLSGSFVADSAFDHIVIGGFKDNNSIQIANMSSGTLALSYYYIDSVVVKPADTVSFVITDTTLCAGDNINVDYTVNSGVAFSSSNTFVLQLSNNFGSFAVPVIIGTATGTTSGTIHATIPLGTTTGGLYKMRVVSSSPNFVTLPSDANIGIGSGKPQPTVHITSPVCEGDTFKLSVTTPGSLTDAIWNGPKFVNSHAAAITVFHAKTGDAGVYTVDVFNYGCEAQVSGSLQVLPKPAKPTGASNSPICSGSELQLLGAGVGTSWMWKDALGNIYIAKDTVLEKTSVAESGPYIFTVFSNGCSASDTIQVTIKDTPMPDLFTNDPCEGDTLFVRNQKTDSGAIYQWFGPAGFTSGQTAVTIPSAAHTNDGYYTLTITALNGCTASDSILARVKDLPQPTTITGNTSLCENDTLKMLASNNSPGVSYNWTGPMSFSENGNAATILDVTQMNRGVYYVTANLNGCFRKDSIPVIVNHTPIQPVISGNMSLTEGDALYLYVSNTESGTTYEWQGPDMFKATGTEAAIEGVILAQQGTYTVTASDGGCSSSSLAIVKIEELSTNTDLQVFPNANDGDFFIKCTTKYDQKIQLILRNSGGQVVYRQDFFTANKTLTQRMLLKDSLASGIYTVTIIADGLKLTKRLTVRRM